MNVCRVGNKASDFKLFSKDVTGIIVTGEAVPTLILMVASAPLYPRTTRRISAKVSFGSTEWDASVFVLLDALNAKICTSSLVTDCLLVPSSASSDSTVETAALKVSNFTAFMTFYRPGLTTFIVGPVRGKTTAKACATHTRRI